MNFFREKVSGNKKRFIDENYNLDLSYITPRVIAMAFPASGLSKMYRNDINDVARFLKERHNSNYLIINLSGKKYDYEKFENRVVEYDWIDHHAPPISILFDICAQIHDFLEENPLNIVAVNCMAGKGRTGTIICCLMLYCSIFTTADQAFEYYSKKRFSVGEGVTQPSQRRYVYYFERLINQKIYYPYPIILYDLQVNKIPVKDSTMRPYLEVYLENNDKLYYSNKVKYFDQKKMTRIENQWQSIMNNDLNLIVSGDLTLKLFQQKLFQSKKVARIAFNTAFLEENTNETIFNLIEIDPDSLIKKPKYNGFCIKVKYKKICSCSNKVFPVETCNKCIKYLKNEKVRWSEIHQIIELINLNKFEGIMCLFGDDDDDFDEILENDEQKQSFTELKLKGAVRKHRLSKAERKAKLNNSREESDCLIF